jgi:hypothetical protein
MQIKSFDKWTLKHLNLSVIGDCVVLGIVSVGVILGFWLFGK